MVGSAFVLAAPVRIRAMSFDEWRSAWCRMAAIIRGLHGSGRS